MYIVHFLQQRKLRVEAGARLHAEQLTALVSGDIVRTFVNETLPSMLVSDYTKALA